MFTHLNLNFSRTGRMFGATTAAVFALALPGQALAGTVDADYLPSFDGGSVSGSVDTVGHDGGGGLFLFQRTGGTATETLVQASGKPAGQFHAICLEFNEDLATGEKTYNLIALGTAPIQGSAAPAMGAQAGVYGATRADDLAYLLGGIYSDFSKTAAQAGLSDVQLLALQLAVWEIANEDLSVVSKYDVNSGGTAGTIYFTSEDGSTTNADFLAAMVQATTWLDNLNDGLNTLGWSKAQRLAAISITPGTHVDKSQDFVVQLEDDSNLVPIPAAVWLLGSGLLGLFGIGRRRKAA